MSVSVQLNPLTYSPTESAVRRVPHNGSMDTTWSSFNPMAATLGLLVGIDTSGPLIWRDDLGRGYPSGNQAQRAEHFQRVTW